MEHYFPQELPGDIFWCSELHPAVRRSAFSPYRDIPKTEFGQGNYACNYGDSSKNMNKRMIEFLRRKRSISTTTIRGTKEEEELEKERSFRHMINERMRRKNQKHGYSALHSMLPIGTKNEKNSIVQTATIEIQQLQSCKERLTQRKMELEAILLENSKEMMSKTSGTKIKVKVANPTSGVDSMVEVLNYLKRLGLKATNIRSVFSQEEFMAELEIETKVEAAEIEEALRLTLYEAELRLRSYF